MKQEGAVSSPPPSLLPLSAAESIRTAGMVWAEADDDGMFASDGVDVLVVGDWTTGTATATGTCQRSPSDNRADRGSEES